MIHLHNLRRPDKPGVVIPGVVMHTMMMKCFGNHYTDVTMSAMASQITSVSIVYSTVGPAPSGKQVRRQVVHITGLFCEGNPPVTNCSPNKAPVMWKVHYFDRNYTEIHFWGTSHFSDGLFYRRICTSG